MNICLFRPPTFVPNEAVYPYNIDCISTVLEAEGHDVKFVDGELMASREMQARLKPSLSERILSEINVKVKAGLNSRVADSFFQGNDSFWDTVVESVGRHNASLIGISCYSSSMSSTTRFVEHYRRRYGPETFIVAGGIHPTSLPEETLKAIPGLDAVVIGEGEDSIRHLSRVLSAGGDILEVDGLCLRKGDKFVRTSQRATIQDLGTLPACSFSHVVDGHKDFVLLTSRGCPFDCHFCASKVIWGRKVRYRPPELVAEEIKNLRMHRPDLEYIRFGDDTFTIRKDHMEGIVNSLEEAGIRGLNISVGSRIDTMDEQKLEILKRLGVHHVSFGVESGSERILSAIKKQITVSKVVPVVKMLNDAGISTTTFFIINHPMENGQDMESTLSLIKLLNEKCSRNVPEINIGFPYPGTTWWDYAESNGLTSTIDFYHLSHMYTHQSSPAVNMTVEPEETLLEYKSRMVRFESKKRIREMLGWGLRRLFRDPLGFFRKILGMLR